MVLLPKRHVCYPGAVPDPILQSSFPEGPPWMHPAARSLPGLTLLDEKDWILRDDAFAAQMELRDALIAERTSDVIQMLPEAKEAAQECLNHVVRYLAHDPAYRIIADKLHRPDGIVVVQDRDQPLHTLGRLIQSDMCLLQKQGSEHVLTGAVLCFPASWRLDEKIGRPLSRIHDPVDPYDEAMAKRVQRLFGNLKPQAILTRSNALLYDDPALFAPKSEGDPPREASDLQALFVRSERQTLRVLPKTGAIAFGIHTFMVRVDSLFEAERHALWETLRQQGRLQG
ncbi:MAG: DUF3445 domain-containing protein [Paracoccaceae bacterium]|nr:DUF3445 domain-containing protein [Paracoccaceae bacterium]